MFGSGDAVGKLNEFEEAVNNQSEIYDVFGLKFCYIDWWFYNVDPNIDRGDAYISMMLRLENNYPTKKFIWATQVLHFDWTGMHPEDIQTFNDKVRAYANSHNKPLYDLADIEAYTLTGTHCTQTLDGVSYEIICPEWRADPAGFDAHPNVPGGVRLAKGFWWLMARISGWDGN